MKKEEEEEKWMVVIKTVNFCLFYAEVSMTYIQ